jgi:hypothetical protein
MAGIKEKIRIHDKYQFEIKYTYPLDQQKPVTEYTVETFLFVPNNLGITPLSYSKEDFYRDMQKYIRLQTPVFQLQSIISGDDCPLARLRKSMEELTRLPEDPVAQRTYNYHLKMFCSIFKSAVRDEELFIETGLEEKDRKQIIDRLAAELKTIVLKFRELKSTIQVPHIGKKQLALYSFADEYISLLIEKIIYKLLNFLKLQNDPKYSKYSAWLLKLVKNETAYRIKNNYPSIPSEGTSNEGVIYRSRILKKIMGNILFLRTHVKTEGKILEQVSMGIAAGLAMAFATTFIFLSRTTFEDLTVSLLAVLVIIYVFKDRMKEISKNIIVGTLRKFIYDYKTDLLTNMDNKIGFCRETFSFIKENDLPDLVKKIRNKDYIGELDNGYAPENIIFSKKYIKIYSSRCKRLLSDFNVDGINDIIRFNVRHFLNKMDNPLKALYVPDGDDYAKVRAECVYHLNLVLRYGMNGNYTYHKFRIILNRSGIRRIEAIPCAL